MTRIIQLPVYNIVVTLNEVAGKVTGGTITSTLREQPTSTDEQKTQLNAAIDTLEAFILAAAIADIDIESPAFLEAIEVTADKVGNYFT